MSARETLPPGQQLVAPGKWPTVGEREPRSVDGPWQLSLVGCVENETSFSLSELNAMQPVTQVVDIHCVTRWSKLGVEFTGISLANLLEQVGLTRNARFVSFVSRSQRDHSTSLALPVALSLGTLIALQVDGKPLANERGGPIRNIVPGRYFYKSVKWLERIELLEHDRLGYWEAESGYHNQADPWQEQRYMAPTIDKRLAARLIASRDFAGHDLRSIDASNRDLQGLGATRALLRDADFRGADLCDADFSGANLSNAHFELANLQNAKLINADLEGANFSGADLRGADFTGASLFGVSFCQQSPKRISARLDCTTRFDDQRLRMLTPEQFEFVSSTRGS